MRRGEFIVKGALLMCSGSCLLAACSSSEDDSMAPPPIDGGGNGGDNEESKISVSLSSLGTIGDQASKSGVLFIRIGSGNTSKDFLATEAVCPHQGGQLVWKQDNEFIECQLHFSRYQTDGGVIRGPQNAAGNTRTLKVYSVTINDDTITATKS